MFIQNTIPFSELRAFFLPAMYITVLDGNNKSYQLSIPFKGREIVVKKSNKSFSYAGFNQVISGAVLRMQKIFHPDKLKLEVYNLLGPNFDDLSLSFELINKNKFKIADEDYYASVRVSYSYDDVNKITYAPIIYREVCSNGMVTVLSSKFKEVISPNKIFEIGSEWTRCNFETIKNNYTRYFNQIQNKKINDNINDLMNNILPTLNEFDQIRQKIGLSEKNDRTVFENDIKEVSNSQRVLRSNINILGNNEFALWNTLTEIASRERNHVIRHEMLSLLGKNISKEVDKMLKKEKRDRSNKLLWNELADIAD